MKQILLFGLFIGFFSAALHAQVSDTIQHKTDSLQKITAADTVVRPQKLVSVKPLEIRQAGLNYGNQLLHATATPVSLAIAHRTKKTNDAFFYMMASLLFFLALLKTFFGRYFTNLFKVFFNTSLRQNQITDQLLLAKLPSFLFNIFFVISAGIYVFTLLLHLKLISAENSWTFIFFSVVFMGLIYLIKFCLLKFTGWITGLKETVNIYVFVIFLTNKVLGIFLIPISILLYFSDKNLASFASLASMMGIGILLLLRFFRSYGLLQNQLKISRIHFLMYIMGMEILPLFLIYKGLMIYLSKIL